MTTITKQIEELARILGESPESIKTRTGDWTQFMREGVIVEVHIGRWRGLASLEDGDLGLPFDNEHNAKLIDLGDKLLLPPEMAAKVQSLEVGARNFLRTRCTPTAWGWFLPVTAFEDVMIELRERKSAYVAYGNQVADRYEEWKEELLEAYRAEARIAFRRSRAFERDGYYNVQSIVDEAEFIDRYLAAIDARIPSAETIRASYYFDIELSYVPLPSLLETDAAEASRLAAEAEQRRIEARKERAQAYLDVDVIEQTANDRRRQLAAMNGAVVNEARQQKEKLVTQFLTDVTAELRQRTFEVMQQALATTQKNGSLQARTVVSLRNWIETVRSLNFYGDAEIESMIAPVEAQLSASPDGRSFDSLTQAMKDVADVTKFSLLNLGVRPRGGKEIDAAPAPAPELVRQARARLGLRDITPAADLTQGRTRRANSTTSAGTL